MSDTSIPQESRLYAASRRNCTPSGVPGDASSRPLRLNQTPHVHESDSIRQIAGPKRGSAEKQKFHTSINQ